MRPAPGARTSRPETPRRPFACGPRSAPAALALLGVLAMPVAALAQAGALVPPAGTPVPRLAPQAAPQAGPGGAVPAAPAPSPDDAALARTVRVAGVVVEGATAFPEAQMRALAPAPGPAVSLREIEAARAAMLARYRDAGYPLTTVDAVLARDGVLRFVVGEGYVAEVKLDGDIGPAGVQVLRFLNRLVGVRPLDVATMERYLLLAGDVPGVSVRAILRPAGAGPGALTLVAQVARKPFGGYVTADNRAYRLTGREQALAAVQANAFTSFGERSELALFYASGGTQLFGQVGTEFFVGSSGARVRLYAGTGSANPAAPLRTLGYEGDTTVAGIGVAYPLIRRRQQTLTLGAAFDLIDSTTEADGVPGTKDTLGRDHLRIARVSGDWSVYDLLAGADRPALNAFGLRVSHGIDGLGASSSGDPRLSRPGARTDFTKIDFEVSRTQTLFRPFGQATVALLGVLAGQWSDDILPQAEKYYVGGARLGRGYYAGEITGDKALAGTVELQLAIPWEVTALQQAVRLDPMLYAFYDAARTWENVRGDPSRDVSSAGVGVRMSFTEHIELQLEGVHRFETRPNGAGGFVDEDSRQGVYWRALVRF